MHSFARSLRLIPLVAMIAALGACGDGGSTGVDDDDPLAPGATTMSLYLTDAPGDVSRVWLDITRVTMIGGGPQEVLLDEPTGLIEVTELVDQAMQLVQDLEIDPGSYAQVRLQLGAAVLETDDGDVYAFGGAEHPDGLEITGDLMCPGCTQSGLKVILAGSLDVEEGEEAGLLLDFDVSQSFGKQAGNSGKWVMRPVIRATKGDDDEMEAGDDGRVTITGRVELADGLEIPACPAGKERDVEDFIPLATATTLTDEEGGAIVVGGETRPSGVFHLRVLDPDTYELGFAAEVELDEGGPLVFEAEVAPASLQVVEGDEELGGVIYTITSATCGS